MTEPSQSVTRCQISIVVVSYNTREMTLECLRSVFTQTQSTTFEILVVDNESSDGSADAIASEFPQVRLIRSGANLGFARANNVAAEQAQGDYLLLLNPDTVILDRAIDKVLQFATEHPEARIWGGRTVFADGSLNPASCWGCMTPWNLFCNTLGLTKLFPHSELFNSEAYGRWQRDQVRQVDIVTGCFLLIRRDFWNELKGFNPLFFMYGEEADLCLRARRNGARPMVTPTATLIHYGAASETVEVDRVVKIWKGKTTLIRQHWPRSLVWFGVGCQLLTPLSRGVLLRLAGTFLRRPRLIEKGKMWSGLWQRRHEWVNGYQTQPRHQSVETESRQPTASH